MNLEEMRKKIVNLELVFGFSLETRTGLHINHILSPLDKFQSNLLLFSPEFSGLYTPYQLVIMILSKFIDFIK